MSRRRTLLCGWNVRSRRFLQSVQEPDGCGAAGLVDGQAAFGQLGMPTVRHVANPATTPLYVLQLVQQIETTFARVAFVAAGESDVLRAMLEATTSSPVLDGREEGSQLALQCAKIFGLEDTVLFGRALLTLANARSNVLAADSSLQQQAAAQGVALG